jgi:hypothetical protein
LCLLNNRQSRTEALKQRIFDRKPALQCFLNSTKKELKKGSYPLEQVSCQDGNMDCHFAGVLQPRGDKIQAVPALAHPDTAFDLVSFA